jgi:hypothetical protein
MNLTILLNFQQRLFESIAKVKEKSMLKVMVKEKVFH